MLKVLKRRHPIEDFSFFLDSDEFPLLSSFEMLPSIYILLKLLKLLPVSLHSI